MLVFLAGCRGIPSYQGGQSTYSSEKETVSSIKPVEPPAPKITGNETLDKANQELYKQKLEHYETNKANELSTTTKEKTQVIVTQPENAKEPAALNIVQGKDGYLDIDTSTGHSYDVADLAKIDAKFKSLNPLIFVGVGLIVCAAFIAYRGNLMAAGLSAGTGIGLIVLSVLLAQYTAYFLVLAILIIIGIVIYFVHKSGILYKANVDVITTVEALRKDLSPEQDNKWFQDKKASAKIIQSPSTMKVVKNIKAKEQI